jgi:hypothetical protein
MAGKFKWVSTLGLVLNLSIPQAAIADPSVGIKGLLVIKRRELTKTISGNKLDKEDSRSICKRKDDTQYGCPDIFK